MADSDVFMGKPAIRLVKKHGMDRMRTRGETDMARVTHAASHLSLAEVKQRMRTYPRGPAATLADYLQCAGRATTSSRDCSALWRVQSGYVSFSPCGVTNRTINARLLKPLNAPMDDGSPEFRAFPQLCCEAKHQPVFLPSTEHAFLRPRERRGVKESAAT